jgi:hypothetical protein
MVRRDLTVLLATVLTLAAAGVCQAQLLSGPNGALDWQRVDGAYERVPGCYANLGIMKFINSFASYEYPYEPGYTGKSRLEFPIDNWFGGIKFGQTYSNMSFNAEIWCRLNEETASKMQDSDWEDDVYPPDQKTAFSESKNRMTGGYFVDFNADWEVPYGSSARLRPVVGVRYQRFHFIAGDGFQWGLPLSDFPTEPLKGDVYDDSFAFLHLYFGVKSCLWLGPLVVTLQADYAWLKADQDDRHLLRGLFRMADNGRGYCWHLAAGVSLPVSNSVTLRLEGDFKRLATTVCSHNWWDRGIPGLSWDGAKIWSDQQSVAGYAEFRF